MPGAPAPAEKASSTLVWMKAVSKRKAERIARAKDQLVVRVGDPPPLVTTKLPPPLPVPLDFASVAGAASAPEHVALDAEEPGPKRQKKPKVK